MDIAYNGAVAPKKKRRGWKKMELHLIGLTSACSKDITYNCNGECYECPFRLTSEDIEYYNSIERGNNNE